MSRPVRLAELVELRDPPYVRYGDRIFQTSERGTIEFITDGTTLRLKTER